MDFFCECKELRIDPKQIVQASRIALRTSSGLVGEKMAQSAGSTSIEHRLALFVETCHDGVVLFETNEQAWQWRLVVVALFEALP